ncbi:hypothetical protein [Streptomyces salyersiae]|uniref:DUF2637 domain-containing protein n=1 Tax=Streptomyces salyersiae TaxID=3075530 RepID=A0ABU2RPE6_9ACTN|nr:hypothetical protein [Streptomyces sp. DSM 41770]MDT0430382.1 hypothetical protein [Streptomyces sp. DSM 41770]
MTHPIAMSLPLGIDPVYAVAAVGVLALVLAGWSIRRNRTRAGAPRAGTPTVWVAALAALGCTAYSAETSWFFAADYLGMTDTVQRAAFFSTAELALFANALLARQNLRNQGAPGVPGTLVWVLTGVQIIPAYAESGPVGGTVRAIVGPVMAAMLWHLAMGIELRLHKPDASSQGLLATLGREVRERLLSRLGVATRNRDAAQITRERATERAGALASRLAKMPEKDRKNRHGRRIERRLETALSRSGVGTDPDQRRALLEQLAARRHAAALASVALPSPWTQPSWEQEDDRGDRSPRAAGPGTRTLPEEHVSSTGTVPEAGPRIAASIGDRAVGDAAEPVGDGPHAVPSGNGDRPHTVPTDNGDRIGERDPRLPGQGEEAKAEGPAVIPGTGEGGDVAGGNVHEVAAQRGGGPSPAAVPNGDEGREQPDTETGTEHDGNRPHTVPTDNGDREQPDTETGTEHDGNRPHTVPTDNGDREQPDTETGTEHDGNRPHTVPLSRKPPQKGSRNRPGAGKGKSRRNGPRLTVEQMVERVRPHVPALLERDGNASVTRPQLREILRAQNIQGGRNERLTPVLQLLRDEAATTTTRSTAR